MMFERIFDPYERKARLAPALLTLAPVMGVLIGLYDVKPELDAASVGILTTFGFLYVLASISRELGKRLEETLFTAWGGKPTTQILRHTDRTLDSITKARYHAFLSEQIGIQFPNRDREQDNPIAADHSYAAGAKWLLDQTRDTKKYSLLFKENIAYGFRRNCLGLKPYALSIAAASFLWGLVKIKAVDHDGIHLDTLLQIAPGALTAIAVSTVAIIVWLFFFTKRTVRTAAFSYADTLLRACDTLSPSKQSNLERNATRIIGATRGYI